MFLQGWHGNYKSRTRGLLEKAKITLDAAGTAQLHTRICSAAERMFQKVYDHLLEEKEVIAPAPAQGTGAGASTGSSKDRGKAAPAKPKKPVRETITTFLDVFQRRKHWDIRQPSKLPAADAAGIDAALLSATGADPSAELRQQQ